MGYDKELDKSLFRNEINISDPMNKGMKFKFILSVMQYNGGEKKIDIKRLVYGAGNKGMYQPLGRVTKDEMESLIPAIEEAMELM
jgi:hypothetical protein